MKGLHQDIIMLVCAGYVHELDESILNLIFDGMTIYFHMFGSFMENRISSNVHCKFVVTEEFSTCMYPDMKASKKMLTPK